MPSPTLAYDSSKQPPPPVDGTVIRRSATKTVIGLVVNAGFLFLFGAFLVWAKLKHTTLDAASSPKEVTNWGFLIGIGALIAMPIVSYRLLRALWVRQRLVIAPDRLQTLERRGGQDVVTLQVPYANVADVRYDVTATERRVGIDLRNVDDPDTYPDAARFTQSHELHRRHLVIPGGYAQSPRAIAATIERAFVAWGGTLGPSGTGANLSPTGPTTAAKVLSIVALLTCLVPALDVITSVLAIRRARHTEGWPSKLNLLSLIISIAVTGTVLVLWIIGK